MFRGENLQENDFLVHEYINHCNLLSVIIECHPIKCQALCRISKCLFNSLFSQNMYLLINIVIRESTADLHYLKLVIIGLCYMNVD